MARLYCARTDTHEVQTFQGPSGAISLPEPPVYTIYQGDALCKSCFDRAVEHSSPPIPPISAPLEGPAAFRLPENSPAGEVEEVELEVANPLRHILKVEVTSAQFKALRKKAELAGHGVFQMLGEVIADLTGEDGPTYQEKDIPEWQKLPNLGIITDSRDDEGKST